VFTVREAARRIGVSPNLVYGWCAAGLLRHYRFGAPGRRGKILIAEDDWAAFIAARKVDATEARPPAPAAGRTPSGSPLRHLRIRRGPARGDSRSR
jgi:excisionase family DNA binding protein